MRARFQGSLERGVDGGYLVVWTPLGWCDGEDLRRRGLAWTGKFDSDG